MTKEIKTKKTKGEFTVSYQQNGYGGVIPVIDGTPHPELLMAYVSDEDRDAGLDLLKKALEATNGDIFAAMQYMHEAAMTAAKDIRADESMMIDGKEIVIDYDQRAAYYNTEMIANMEDIGCELNSEAIRAILMARAKNVLHEIDEYEDEDCEDEDFENDDDFEDEYDDDYDDDDESEEEEEDIDTDSAYKHMSKVDASVFRFDRTMEILDDNGFRFHFSFHDRTCAAFLCDKMSAYFTQLEYHDSIADALEAYADTMNLEDVIISMMKEKGSANKTGAEILAMAESYVVRVKKAAEELAAL